MFIASFKKSFVQRYLDPADSLSEVFFGLIMVLTFTLGAGLAASEEDIHVGTMLVAIVGGNLAWGIIDGVMYIMGCVFERSRQARIVYSLSQVTDETEAIATIRYHLDSTLSSLLPEEERQDFYQRILKQVQTMPPQRTPIELEDVLGAIASFGLVFATTLPAVIPFVIIDNFHQALRLSNSMLLVLLFIVGYSWATYTYSNRWLAGLLLMLLGTMLVGVAIALGG